MPMQLFVGPYALSGMNTIVSRSSISRSFLRSFPLRRFTSRELGAPLVAKALAHPLQVGYTMPFIRAFPVHLVDRSVRDIPGGCVRMRQRFLRLAALMSVAVLVLAACGSDDGGETPPADDAATSAEPVDISGTTLTISNWDAYMPKSVVKDFEAETGVTVEYAIHTTNEDIMGKLTAANGTGFDLVFVSGPFVEPSTAWVRGRDRSVADPEHRQPRHRGDRAGLRPGQHALGALHVGHDGHLLPDRPGAADTERPGKPSTRPSPTPRAR